MTWNAATMDAMNQTFSTVFWNYTRPSVYCFSVGFTIAPGIGSTWTNSGVTFTALQLTDNGDGSGVLYASGSGDPEMVVLPGTLTKASGTGDTTMAYISVVDVNRVKLTFSAGAVGFAMTGTKNGHVDITMDDGLTYTYSEINALWPHPSMVKADANYSQGIILFEPTGTHEIWVDMNEDGTAEICAYFNSRIHPTHSITTEYTTIPLS